MNRRWTLGIIAALAFACAADEDGPARAPIEGDDDVQPPLFDLDGDNIENGTDNCPNIANPTQDDVDFDGIGDPCDDCPTVSDPEQGDEDLDGNGDACQGCHPEPEPTPPPTDEPVDVNVPDPDRFPPVATPVE